MDDFAAPSHATASAKPPKSPPMAFQMTSNDSLWAPANPNPASHMSFRSPNYMFSPGTNQKLELEFEDPMQQELQSQIEKQTEALRLQHKAFAAERECWDSERDRLYRRVTLLEALLKAATGHSPAKSPATTPYGANGFTPSPLSQPSNLRSSVATTSSRLPSIAESESPTQPSPVTRRRGSSITRENAPSFIEIPQVSTIDGHAESIQIGEEVGAAPTLPITPPVTRNTLSPPPAAYRQNAGHTPLKMPLRPLVELQSPARSTFSEPAADTPTRHNTEHNASMLDEEDEDKALQGPLFMPELPNTPGEENFTMDMLTARLKHIVEHPEDNEPLALLARSNRPDSLPATEASADAETESKLSIDGLATVVEEEERVDSTTITSPPMAPVNSKTAYDEPEDRGILLRKKASCNFGTPFGQLGPRKF